MMKSVPNRHTVLAAVITLLSLWPSDAVAQSGPKAKRTPDTATTGVGLEALAAGQPTQHTIEPRWATGLGVSETPVWLSAPESSVQQSAVSPPDGCSLGLPEIWRHRLDRALLNTCLRHDLCWRTRGSCTTGFPGLGLKLACDAAFLGELLAICTATQAAMKAAGSSKEDVKKFGDRCQEAASAVFLGVSANVRRFVRLQCFELCNARICRLMGQPQQAEACCPEPPCPQPRPIES